MNIEILKFRAWDGLNKKFTYWTLNDLCTWDTKDEKPSALDEWEQYTGLKDKNGVEIYEGDIVAKEQVYHFIDREGWEPAKKGKWIIIGEKVKNFTGKKEEKYVAGYCNIVVIEWNVKSVGYEPFSDSMENCGHCGGGDNPADYVVLGNIHQHPELLNS